MSTEVERFVQDEEGMRLFQQERLVLEVTELLHVIMEEKNIKRSELAKMLGRSRGRITQILDGNENLTLHTVADAFSAMGKMLCVKAKDIAIKEVPFDVVMPTQTYSTERHNIRWVCLEQDEKLTAFDAFDETALAG
jgi:DNA-binding phage protein